MVWSVLFNSAGIIRDRMIVTMSEEDSDDIVLVPPEGPFATTPHEAQVRVLAPVDVGPERLVIGMEFAVETPVLRSDDDGTEVVAFRFVEVRSG